ncbi:hypothetical protein TELCIR_18250 [Teladorsagia circumcincta]|uniref:Uncharacterized protein n=1 Tax=Teladorsagia circumcincta TaxID=45464 RepID=A0A2G9TQT6_TELCI|nr:hypothetical protein TELCIR_18250 [Teladorsagia circumcincta]
MPKPDQKPLLAPTQSDRSYRTAILKSPDTGRLADDGESPMEDVTIDSPVAEDVTMVPESPSEKTDAEDLTTAIETPAQKPKPAEDVKTAMEPPMEARKPDDDGDENIP